MNMWGADPDALDGLAAQFKQTADALSNWSATLNAAIHHSPWKGDRAEEFRYDWNRLLMPAMRSAAEFLRGHESALHENANQQRQASGVPVQNKHDSPVSWLKHRVSQGVDELGREVHDGENLLSAGWQEAKTDIRVVANSQAFKDVLVVDKLVSQVTSFAAPIAAIIPGAQPLAAALYVVAVGTGVLATAGDVVEMANGAKPWSAGDLVLDGTSVVANSMGLGAAAKGISLTGGIVKQAATSLGREAVIEDAGDLAASAKVASVFRSDDPMVGYRVLTAVQAGSTTADAAVHSYRMGEDLGDHKYTDAVAEAGGILLDAPDFSGVPTKLGADRLLAGDNYYLTDGELHAATAAGNFALDVGDDLNGDV